MAISKSVFSVYIKAFRFRELFNEMGWNNDRTKQPIMVDNAAFNLSGIAEKSGFRIFTCEPAPGNKLPDKTTRKKIEGKLTRLFQEHLIIFIDEHQQEQVWQLAVRKAGSPTKISETRFSLSQDPELLYQRASGLFFTLDEEEKVTIIDVTKRVADNFQQNNERVTKKFYESFRKEHAVFLKFIQGIDDQLHMDWYASLMLNRLMFCYFIQKKGFLDNNKNYLQDKLKACKEKKGKDQFYSFYRDFLLALFHEGLGAPEHGNNLEVEIGKIPYLNGGLFDKHEIEKGFKNIQIDDKAFEKLFDFFDQYEWHLDTRENASGKDVNPDVIGYIFEKYINDRARMGAYYTKEDITDYIAKNCILPWLFDEVKRNYPTAFADDGWLWQMVKTSGDEYIYDAVKYGIPQNGGLFDDLPNEIHKGFAPDLENKVVDGNGPWLWELRKSWNRHAPSDIALPTEIYREVIERRKRYADIKTKIESGEIKEINQFITYNLNIRQFVQDVVETTEDAGFIRHFYKALSSITILDPTCGSGAFLFAAMNILEPLYEACILRMQNFILESAKVRHTFFEKTLAQVNAPEHPNLQYFIYKSIILNNLYGVDIMNEAVEIAKLRLFLKLVATVDANYRKPNLGLEPLPDVDFNIRAGNTLVGYATEAQLKDAFFGKLDFDNDAEKIKEKCDIVGRAFTRYKEIQLQGNAEFEDFRNAKDNLNQRLDTLRDELDRLLHKHHYSNVKYDHWLATHNPFHWFAEFYEIVAGKGGFDVVIGNPPYVGYTRKNRESKKSISEIYTVINYKTIQSTNLYAFTIERSSILMNIDSKMGMIIPISAFSNNSMKTLQSFVRQFLGNSYISSFHQRPAQLFEGVLQRLNIFIVDKTDSEKTFYTTGINRWFSHTRKFLFQNLEFVSCNQNDQNHLIKIGALKEVCIYEKYRNNKPISICLRQKNGKNRIAYCTAGGGYWVTFLNSGFDSDSLSNKYACFQDDKNSRVFSACLNSNLFWWYYSTNFDLFNFKDYMIFSFKFLYPSNKIENKLLEYSNKMEKCLLENASYYTIQSRTKGANDTITYNKQLCKEIMDNIDSLLAQHYGFIHEELDFIINYDIKYRMGKELHSNGGDDV